MLMSLSPKNFVMMLLGLLICLYIHKQMIKSPKMILPEAVKASMLEAWSQVIHFGRH